MIVEQHGSWCSTMLLNMGGTIAKGKVASSYLGLVHMGSQVT
jgi:hypothetical protein